MSQQYDRFHLETEILNVWHTKDDLDIITERFLDELLTVDEVGNLLIGLSAMHDIRCQKLFLIFETMIHEKCFNRERQTIKDSSGDQTVII